MQSKLALVNPIPVGDPAPVISAVELVRLNGVATHSFCHQSLDLVNELGLVEISYKIVRCIKSIDLMPATLAQSVEQFTRNE